MLEIKWYKITLQGIRIKFSKNPLNFFYTLPGTLRVGRTQLEYLFLAKYDVDAVLEFLMKLPKKRASILLDVSTAENVSRGYYLRHVQKPGTIDFVPGLSLTRNLSQSVQISPLRLEIEAFPSR